MFWKRCNHLQKFGEFLLSLAIFEVSVATAFYFYLAILFGD